MSKEEILKRYEELVSLTIKKQNSLDELISLWLKGSEELTDEIFKDKKYTLESEIIELKNSSEELMKVFNEMVRKEANVLEEERRKLEEEKALNPDYPREKALLEIKDKLMNGEITIEQASEMKCQVNLAYGYIIDDPRMNM